jgi:GTPase SAR1 family protein
MKQKREDFWYGFQLWLIFFLHLLIAFLGATYAAYLIKSKAITFVETSQTPSIFVQIVYVISSVILWLAFLRSFSVKLIHVKYITKHPPIWLAWIAGIGAFSVVQSFMLPKNHTYSSVFSDWCKYFYVPMILALNLDYFYQKIKSKAKIGVDLHYEGYANSDGSEINNWIAQDRPSSTDYFDTFFTARKISEHLSNGTRSIGLIGPFGSGKSTIIKEVIKITQDPSKPFETRLIISTHSCWGFDSSAASINSMLGDALEKVADHIDTFPIRSLPESYRATFMKTSPWSEGILNTFLKPRGVFDQFSKLSSSLSIIGARLVFIVEDLDRNESKSFDVQEVQAFLQQLKQFPNISFVLVGGAGGHSRLDFTKLCDVLEEMPKPNPMSTSMLFKEAYRNIIENNDGSYTHIHDAWEKDWTDTPNMRLRSVDSNPIPDLLGDYVDNPRSIRDSIHRSYRTWDKLRGEISLSQLIVFIVIRSNTPDIFNFLLEKWFVLSERRKEDKSSNSKHLFEQLNSLSEKANKRIDLVIDLISILLPLARQHLDSHDSQHKNTTIIQSVSDARYWWRAVREYVHDSEIRDQSVIRDFENWTRTSDAVTTSDLIENLCSGDSEYERVFRNLLPCLSGLSEEGRLTLADHLINRMLLAQGQYATHSTNGFHTLGSLLGDRRVPFDWLKNKVVIASKKSIAFAHALIHFFHWGHRLGRFREDENTRLLQSLNHELRGDIQSAFDLYFVLNPYHPFVLHDLIFDPDVNRDSIIKQLSDWAWLKPIFYEAIQHGNVTIAMEFVNLIIERDSDRVPLEPFRYDALILPFFADESEKGEIAGLLSEFNLLSLESSMRDRFRGVSSSLALE